MTPGKPSGAIQHSGPDDAPMTGTYVAALIVEALVIAALWVLGRMYS
ncbi:MAG: hypothetical protein AB7Q29_15690 [Vicinamibacterales bacterium]